MATRIKSFGKRECQIVRETALAALEKVAAEFGVKEARTKGKYRGDTSDITFTFAVVTDSGVPADFVRDCAMIGMKPEDYGRTFYWSGGKEYRVSGLDLKRIYYPILAVAVASGKTYRFPTEIVAKLRAK